MVMSAGKRWCMSIAEQDLNRNISVDPEEYKSCLDVLEHQLQIKGIKAEIRLHYIKFDGNGQPMVKALANMLYDQIIGYCIAARNRPDQLDCRQAAKLTKDARNLFRHPTITDSSPDKTGEAGEILLYVLMESVLKAPQLVSKMELKTNHKDEVKGSDGIHARYDKDEELIDFYFGESKLYQNSAEAIRAAFDSIEQFHEVNMDEHEYTMVTKHFKYADEKLKEAISSFIVHGRPGSNIRVNHACLIGYDFSGYQSIKVDAPKKMLEEFSGLLLSDGERLCGLLQKGFDSFSRKCLFFEVFLIPFPSVKDFRNAFNDALN
jgi:hypothetical protein